MSYNQLNTIPVGYKRVSWMSLKKDDIVFMNNNGQPYGPFKVVSPKSKVLHNIKLGRSSVESSCELIKPEF